LKSFGHFVDGTDSRRKLLDDRSYNVGMSDENAPAMRSDLNALEIRLLEGIEKSETTLLREFRKWAISFESRFRANQTLVEGFSDRMVSLEERVSDLEAQR